MCSEYDGNIILLLSWMLLNTYKKKRDFSKSPEPHGGKGKVDRLSFVVQKHRASHLHYDFRLEIENVLKSWAVPKGPSINPGIKHLAMMVEDHPYNYQDFEGLIPSGYGAGTVMVWDAGSFRLKTSENLSKKEMEHELLGGLAAGKLHIILHGKKLKGEFALVKTKNRGENAWLLLKIKDDYATAEDILKKTNLY